MLEDALNKGQPHLAVCNSWGLSNAVVKKLKLYCENKRQRDFFDIHEFQWGHLADYDIDDLIQYCKGPGVKNSTLEDLRSKLLKLKDWTIGPGHKTPFTKFETDHAKNTFETVEDYEKESLRIRNNHTSSINLKNIHHSSLYSILCESNHPDAKEMLQYLEDDIKPQGSMIEEQFYIDWKKQDAGYHITINSKLSPRIKIVERWDAVVYGYQISLVRVCPYLSLGAAFEVYVNLDDNGLRIVAGISTPKYANNAIKNFFDREGIKANDATMLTLKDC